MSILDIFKWFSGYVDITVFGESAPLFLNFLIKNSVKVWNVRKISGGISITLLLKDFKILPKLRRQFKHKIKIRHTKFSGFPKKIMQLLKRKSLILGVAFFIIIHFTLSQFIWNIEIVGNQTVSDSEIIKAYTSLGVYGGMPRHQLDSYRLRDRLPLLIKNISWCSFNLEGTKLTINITEVQEFDKTNKKTYSNLISKADGIIKSVDITSGNQMVSVGTVVKKGDILVSGAPVLNSQQFVSSVGKVLAETNRKITVNIPKSKTVYTKNGRTEKRGVISLFGFCLPLYLNSIDFDAETEINEKNLKFLGKSLPIKYTERTFYEILKEDYIRDKDAALNDAKALLLQDIKKYKINEFTLLSYNIIENADAFTVIFECKCIEDITEYQKINVST